MLAIFNKKVNITNFEDAGVLKQKLGDVFRAADGIVLSSSSLIGNFLFEKETLDIKGCCFICYGEHWANGCKFPRRTYWPKIVTRLLFLFTIKTDYGEYLCRIYPALRDVFELENPYLIWRILAKEGNSFIKFLVTEFEKFSSWRSGGDQLGQQKRKADVLECSAYL